MAVDAVIGRRIALNGAGTAAKFAQFAGMNPRLIYSAALAVAAFLLLNSGLHFVHAPSLRNAAPPLLAMAAAGVLAASWGQDRFSRLRWVGLGLTALALTSLAVREPAYAVDQRASEQRYRATQAAYAKGDCAAIARLADRAKSISLDIRQKYRCYLEPDGRRTATTVQTASATLASLLSNGGVQTFSFAGEDAVAQPQDIAAYLGGDLPANLAAPLKARVAADLILDQMSANAEARSSQSLAEDARRRAMILGAADDMIGRTDPGARGAYQAKVRAHDAREAADIATRSAHLAQQDLRVTGLPEQPPPGFPAEPYQAALETARQNGGVHPALLALATPERPAFYTGEALYTVFDGLLVGCLHIYDDVTCAQLLPDGSARRVPISLDGR